MTTSKPNPGLLQTIYLTQETDSATNLLAYGLRALERSPFNATTLDPVLTMLSIGAEKLLKLSLGFISLEETGSWPSVREMKAYKHDISCLDVDLRKKLRSRSAIAVNSRRVVDAVDAVEADQVWQLLSETLTRYGQSGRFYYLDAIASSKVEGESPISLWKLVEDVATKRDPSLREMQLTASRGQSDWETFRIALNTAVASSLVGWRGMISEAAILGVLGPERQRWGRDIVLPGRQE